MKETGSRGIKKMKLDKNLPLFHSKRGRQLELGNSNIRRSFRATYFIFSLHAENGDDFVVDVRPVAYLLIFYSKLEGRRRVVGFIPVLPSCCRTKLQFLVIGMDFTAFLASRTTRLSKQLANCSYSGFFARWPGKSRSLNAKSSLVHFCEKSKSANRNS